MLTENYILTTFMKKYNYEGEIFGCLSQINVFFWLYVTF